MLTPLINQDLFLQRRLAPGLVNAPAYNNDNMEFHVSTETLGFESIGFRTRALAGAPDAVVVGDSFSFCFTEFADCWVSLLEKATGASFANLGIPATGSLSHARVLEHYGLKLSPRLILWQFNNADFAEDYQIRHEKAPPAAPIVADWPALKDASILARLGSQLISGTPMLSPVYYPRYRHVDKRLQLAFGMPVTFPMTDLSLATNQEGMEAGLKSMLESGEKARARGARLVVVLFPSKEEAYWDVVAGDMTPEERTAISGPGSALMAYCHAHDMECLDLRPGFRARANSEAQMFYTLDSHPNAVGNRVAAELISDYLKEYSLLR